MPDLERVIEELSRRYEYVYASHLNGMTFIWRPLTRAEYYRIVARAERGEDVAYEVCQIGVLHPEGIDFTSLPGGTVTMLSDAIWYISAAPSMERLEAMLNKGRAAMQSVERQAECTIAVVFPGTRIEEMRDWPYVKLIDYMARAEWALNNIHMLPLRFGQVDESGKPAIKPDPGELRKQGIDPMQLINPASLRPQYMDIPVIGGTRDWRHFSLYSGKEEDSKEVKPNVISEQHQWVIEDE